MLPEVPFVIGGRTRPTPAGTRPRGGEERLGARPIRRRHPRRARHSRH